MQSLLAKASYALGHKQCASYAADCGGVPRMAHYRLTASKAQSKREAAGYKAIHRAMQIYKADKRIECPDDNGDLQPLPLPPHHFTSIQTAVLSTFRLPEVGAR